MLEEIDLVISKDSSNQPFGNLLINKLKRHWLKTKLLQIHESTSKYIIEDDDSYNNESDLSSSTEDLYR